MQARSWTPARRCGAAERAVACWAAAGLPHDAETLLNGLLACAGPQLDLPHDATPKQLETLLNGLLAHALDERLPYSFFVQEQQLAEELGAHLLRHKARAQSLSASHSGCGMPWHAAGRGAGRAPAPAQGAYSQLQRTPRWPFWHAPVESRGTESAEDTLAGVSNAFLCDAWFWSSHQQPLWAQHLRAGLYGDEYILDKARGQPMLPAALVCMCPSVA